MEDKIHYSIINRMPYGEMDGVIRINSLNLSEYNTYIQESIDAFTRDIEWEEMWDLNEAKKRLTQNQVLFLLRDSKGALGHVWFKEDLLHNMYMNERRETGTSLRFVLHCFNSIPYRNIKLNCDKWNHRAQNFFKKVGAKEISSYL